MADPMTLLKQDHRTVKKLLRELGDSEQSTDREQLLTKIETELRLHMQIEEELLYPLLGDGDDRQGAETEHELARDGLDKLRELQDAPGFGAAVEMVTAGLQHHIREEETEILPKLKGDMERKEWMELGDRIEAMKSDAAQPSNRR